MTIYRALSSDFTTSRLGMEEPASSAVAQPMPTAAVQMPIRPLRKKIRFAVSEPILRFAQRLAAEKRLRRDHVPPSTTVAETPSVAEPAKSTYLHTRITAVISISDDSFAVDNGVDCVVVKTSDTDVIAKELEDSHVRTLHCFDRNTYNICRAIQKNHRPFTSRLQLYRLKPFPIKPCTYCQKQSCSAWRANAAISHLQKIPFDPMEHRSAEPGRRVYRHRKIAAVLAVGGNGFTLTNGVESISYDKSFNNSILLREICTMNIRTLNCMEELSFRTCLDIRKSYKDELKKLKVVLLDPIKMKDCEACKRTNCHKWKASVGIAHSYKLRFDPINH